MVLTCTARRTFLSSSKVEFTVQTPLAAVSSDPMLNTASGKRDAISFMTECSVAKVTPSGSLYSWERVASSVQNFTYFRSE